MSDAELVAAVTPVSMGGAKRLTNMINACRQVDAEGIPGDVVECGVFKGANIVVARKVSPARTCWLYDTFAGMSEPEPVDVSFNGRVASEKWRSKRDANKGWSAASLGECRAVLDSYGVLDDDVLRFVEGDVLETLSDPANLPDQIAVLRLDTDWYASTLAELRTLYPRLAVGGILIVDDYGHWKGASLAVDGYLGKAVTDQFVWTDYTCIHWTKR